jgi:hypothetical protein
MAQPLAAAAVRAGRSMRSYALSMTVLTTTSSMCRNAMTPGVGIARRAPWQACVRQDPAGRLQNRCGTTAHLQRDQAAGLADHQHRHEHVQLGALEDAAEGYEIGVLRNAGQVARDYRVVFWLVRPYEWIASLASLVKNAVEVLLACGRQESGSSD